MPKRSGWLTVQEQQTWRSFMRFTQLLDEALDRQLQHDAGMPHAYYAVLVRLAEADGEALRMSDLAGTLHYSPSRLSHAVSAMEAKGWVRRRRCEADGRSQLAGLRPAGRRALEAAAPGHVAAVRNSLFDRLTNVQVQQLDAILTDALEGLQ